MKREQVEVRSFHAFDDVLYEVADLHLVHRSLEPHLQLIALALVRVLDLDLVLRLLAYGVCWLDPVEVIKTLDSVFGPLGLLAL